MEWIDDTINQNLVITEVGLNRALMCSHSTVSQMRRF
uniref:Uncharacterized protein n=1 Tax=Anguilla anguilla TaxID=7936 RepID=A0A0E9QJV4_ANGAN